RGVAEGGARGDRCDREGQMNPPRVLLSALLVAAVAVPGPAAAQSRRTPADSQPERDIFRELIEINTTDSLGNTPRAARAMAQRLLAAGFPAADVRVLLGPDAKHGNLVARYRGTGAGGGGVRSSSSRIWMWCPRGGRTGPSTRSLCSRKTATSTGAAPPTTRPEPPCSSPTSFGSSRRGSSRGAT